MKKECEKDTIGKRIGDMTILYLYVKMKLFENYEMVF